MSIQTISFHFVRSDAHNARNVHNLEQIFILNLM